MISSWAPGDWTICDQCSADSYIEDEYQSCENCGLILCPRCFGSAIDDMYVAWCWTCAK